MISLGYLPPRHFKIGEHTGPSHTLRITAPRSITKMSAAPSTVAPETTQQLTKSDLVKYLASGCKPREKWRCDMDPIFLFYLQSAAGHCSIEYKPNDTFSRAARFHITVVLGVRFPPSLRLSWLEIILYVRFLVHGHKRSIIDQWFWMSAYMEYGYWRFSRPNKSRKYL